ncbi:ATP-dependent RNA helicase DB10 [Olea europaea subsp. europaea]|uniref:ATP-dependent RNA helicase DB10 n=1 Tax=Olea europaea subsp. europaea TaxID=158383 RepID=A0A8S0UK26_OLEEU|nr:ATP-dependent RNA helicase DB10 [Olea europaea subsp. europaea]
MAATAMASSTDIRYGPEDPTLSKPWKGLIDGKTGYLYYWNPETNITQYERPIISLKASSAAPDKSLSSSVQKSSQGGHKANDDDDRYNRGSNSGSVKVASGTGSYQSARSRSDHLRDDLIVKASSGLGLFSSKVAESGLSADSYRRQHDITVTVSIYITCICEPDAKLIFFLIEEIVLYPP